MEQGHLIVSDSTNWGIENARSKNSFVFSTHSFDGLPFLPNAADTVLAFNGEDTSDGEAGLSGSVIGVYEH